MSEDKELDDMLALPSDELVEEVLVDVAPTSRPMGDAARALLERSRSYPVNRAAKKNTPERLMRLLNYIMEMPVTADACRRAGVAVTTVKYWLQKSSEGKPGDGFDIVIGGEADENGTEDNTMRFHDAWDAFMLAGVEMAETVAIRRATGYYEPLTYQGRVQYQYDPAKLATSRELGIPEFVPENYLLDQYGAPVPEQVMKIDPDLLMFILKARKPGTYGAKATMDVNIKGGVLVVPMRALVPEDLNVIEAQDRTRGRQLITFDESEGDDDDV